MDLVGAHLNDLINRYKQQSCLIDKSNQNLTGSNQMTLSLNCKEAGDPVCTHTMYGDTEEELLANAKKHGIEVHGYTEETWNEEIAKNSENFRKLIKST